MSGTCLSLHSVGIERDAEVITPFLNFSEGLVGHRDTWLRFLSADRWDRSPGIRISSTPGRRLFVFSLPIISRMRRVNRSGRQKSGDIEEAKEMTNVLFAIEVLIH